MKAIFSRYRITAFPAPWALDLGRAAARETIAAH